MAVLAPFVFWQLLDNNGDPLSGGKVYSYEAGTTTPKDTFTDPSEDTANANPVILDSAGRADIWLEEGPYKFILTDSDDAEIKTVDGFIGNAAGAVVSYNISTNTNITALYNAARVYGTGSFTLSLLPVEDAGDGFEFWVYNESNGAITLDPDTAELINGNSTLVINENEWALISCDGVEWHAFVKSLPDGSVTTAKIADNAVTLGKMENGTQGDVLYYGASGVPLRLGAGTSGQVLKTGGTGANPSWQDDIEGKVAQTVYTQDSAVATTTAQIPYDDTIPQNTEGAEFMTRSITPTSATNLLRIDVVFNYSQTGGTSTSCMALFQDTTADALDAAGNTVTFASLPQQMTMTYWMAAGTTSETTFKVRAGPAGAETMTFNGSAGNRRFGGSLASSITVTEYAV